MGFGLIPFIDVATREHQSPGSKTSARAHISEKWQQRDTRRPHFALELLNSAGWNLASKEGADLTGLRIEQLGNRSKPGFGWC